VSLLQRLDDGQKAEALALQEEKARRAARERLAAFERYVFRIDPAEVHRVWIEALEAIEAGTIRRLLLIAPPGHAKSTLLDIVFGSWYVGRHPDHSLVGVTTTDTLGKLYGDAIGNVVEYSEEWRSVFPGLRPDPARGWSKEGRFVRIDGKARNPTQKDPTFAFFGAGGGVIGRRANGVIIDDPVDQETARSETALASRVAWVRQSILSRLQPGAWAICAGTLWAEGDVVDTLRQTGEWVTLKAKAISEGPEQYVTVEIPDGVKWRPKGFVEVEGEDD
jgi:hypothetical protein